MEQLDLAHREYNLDRLITLSDGVFAIALTLLALELHPPARWDGDPASLWIAMRGSLVAYGVSFVVIGGYRVSHRRSFAAIIRADRVLTLLSLLTLGLVTLVPVGTRLLIDHGDAWGALAVYLSLIAAIGLLNALLWGYAAVRDGIMDPGVTRRSRLAQFVMLTAAPFAAALICFLALGGGGLRFWLAVAGLALGMSAARRALLGPDGKRAPSAENRRHRPSRRSAGAAG